MNKYITAIVIDDEELGRENLIVMLKKHCKNIKVVADASDAFEAKQIIIKLNPDIIFLDINMPKINGFEFLESFTERNFQTIFVSAYDNKEFLIKALQLGAIDFISKPILFEKLIEITEKAIVSIDKKNNIKSTESKELLDSKNIDYDKILITHNNGYTIVKLEEIIRLESLNNYTKFILINDRVIVSSKTLKSYNEILPPHLFFRVHKTHLINVNFIKEFKHREKKSLMLMDGSMVSVAQTKKAMFREFLKNSSSTISNHIVK